MKSGQIPLPIIGITTYARNADGNFQLPAAYVDMVRNAGGLPMLLPPGELRIENILEIIDGLILAGGGDVDPGLYGGISHPTIERLNAERDSFEMLLIKKVLNLQTPVLGICRGMQVLNVAAGGTLVEHLPDRFGTEVIHRGDDRKAVPHVVRLSEGSKLLRIAGKQEFPVMSKHHQGIDNVAPSWAVTARSTDNVVEAIEKPDHPWMLAVMWHPELSSEQDEQRKLVGSFVEAAAEYKAQKRGT